MNLERFRLTSLVASHLAIVADATRARRTFLAFKTSSERYARTILFLSTGIVVIAAVFLPSTVNSAATVSRNTSMAVSVSKLGKAVCTIIVAFVVWFVPHGPARTEEIPLAWNDATQSQIELAKNVLNKYGLIPKSVSALLLPGLERVLPDIVILRAQQTDSCVHTQCVFIVQSPGQFAPLVTECIFDKVTLNHNFRADRSKFFALDFSCRDDRRMQLQISNDFFFVTAAQK